MTQVSVSIFLLLMPITQVWHTMAAQREGAVERAKTEINRKWYEQMQCNDITKRTMDDILLMQRQPPFNHNTLANSVHVLSEAGQVRRSTFPPPFRAHHNNVRVHVRVRWCVRG